ncbi:MAG TPA: prenyltransferase [Syntrophales bacterium]|jgi:1,4-dihydroxy-2-naphthoate octaprenyltransferase|nr:prenyltransferase [Syntrophales bacterium]
MNRGTLKAWFQASRPPFFIATLIPLTIGWILAGSAGPWYPWRFFIITMGALMVHLATNLSNDYFDYIQGTDDGPSIGGSRVIQEGKISPVALKRAIILLYFLAFIIAFYLITTLDLWLMLPVVLFSFFSSLFYVAPPIRYGYHGLGEVFVGINMGPIMVVGTYWVISGRLDWLPFYISLPVGLMVAAILYYQSIPDIRTDRAAGKKTIAVRLGRGRAVRGLIFFWGAIYTSIMVLIWTGHLNRVAIVCLFSIPIFLRLLMLLRKTDDTVVMDEYGKYIRILYFFNGMVIIFSLLFPL